MPPGVGYPGPISGAAAGIPAPKARGSFASDLASLGDTLFQRSDERKQKRAEEARSAALLDIQQEQLALQQSADERSQQTLQITLDEQGRIVADRAAEAAGKPALVNRIVSLESELGRQSDRPSIEAMTPQQLATMSQELRLELNERLRIQLQGRIERERINTEARQLLRLEIGSVEQQLQAHQRARAAVQEELVGINMDVLNRARELTEQAKAAGQPEMTSTQARSMAYEQLFNERLQQLGVDPMQYDVLNKQLQSLQNELRTLRGESPESVQGTGSAAPPSSWSAASDSERAQAEQRFVEMYAAGQITQDQIDQLRLTGAPVSGWVASADSAMVATVPQPGVDPAASPPPPSLSQQLDATGQAVRDVLGTGQPLQQAVDTAGSAAPVDTAALQQSMVAPQAQQLRSTPELTLPGAVPDPVLSRFETSTQLRRRGAAPMPPNRPFWLRPPGGIQP